MHVSFPAFSIQEAQSHTDVACFRAVDNRMPHYQPAVRRGCKIHIQLAWPPFPTGSSPICPGTGQPNTTEIGLPTGDPASKQWSLDLLYP